MDVTPLEAAVVRRIQRTLTERGAWWVKTTGVSLVGCPDLIACYKGHFIALEVKRSATSSYKATKKQLFELGRIRNAGGVAYVAYDDKMLIDILDAIDAAA